MTTGEYETKCVKYAKDKKCKVYKSNKGKKWNYISIIKQLMREVSSLQKNNLTLSDLLLKNQQRGEEVYR